MVWMNLEPAYAKAREDYARRQPETMSADAAVPYEQPCRQFKLTFLGEEYLITHPEGIVKRICEDGEAPLVVRVILLHYLAYAAPVSLKGELISFKELPGGYLYTVPFTNRVIRPLIKYFGQLPEKLVEVGKRLGGQPARMGDVSVAIPVLPKIPITYVLWLGDEEFPPSGNVLFDVSAEAHLPTEDYAVLPGLVLERMKKLAGL